MSENDIIFEYDYFWLSKERLQDKPFQLQRDHVLESVLGFEGTVSHEERKKISRGRGPLDSLGVAQALRDNDEDIKAYKNIGVFNQLGLKDYLLGRTEQEVVDVHTRGAHSRGTALIGELYFLALEPFIKYTNYNALFLKNRDLFEKSIAFSLYLHDVGHLPYSHMLEEIFEEINWTRIGSHHRHDEVPLEQLTPEEIASLKTCMGNCLQLEPDKEIDQAFSMIQDLIAGISGIPFLDAITNSCIDADKIDYIFRDMHYTRKRARLREDMAWLDDFFSNISLSPEGIVRLNGDASLCSLELLEERQFLYRNLYLDPKIRALEKVASVIIISWLTREVSSHLLSELDARGLRHDIDRYKLESDARGIKASLASRMITERFLKYDKKHELNLLLDLCEDLSNDKKRDRVSREWFAVLKDRMGRFSEAQDSHELNNQYNEMIVEEPVYIRKGSDLSTVREIARNIYVNYPCSVLIDIAELPRFLPSSKSRRFRVYGSEYIGETFFVPDRDPGNWTRNRIGKFPIHECDFTELEKNYAQVLMINTAPERVNGGYLYDFFLKQCRNKSIELESSIWR